jgi:hypothetical protein
MVGYSFEGCYLVPTKEVCRMPASRKLPSESILAGWVEAGLSHQEIVDRIREEFHEEVSRSSVSGALSRAGFTKPRRYEEDIPWSPIAVEHNAAYQLTMLRTGARLRAGKTVPVREKARFDKWAEELRAKGLVVHYVYDSPQGFFYVKARPGVDTGLVRIPGADEGPLTVSA